MDIKELEKKLNQLTLDIYNINSVVIKVSRAAAPFKVWTANSDINVCFVSSKLSELLALLKWYLEECEKERDELIKDLEVLNNMPIRENIDILHGKV